MAFETFTFDIVKHIGVISERTDYYGTKWAKEINLVSWNGKQPKVDIREWNPDHTKMNKGLALTDEEAEALAMILHNYVAERSR